MRDISLIRPAECRMQDVGNLTEWRISNFKFDPAPRPPPAMGIVNMEIVPATRHDWKLRHCY